MNKLILAIIKFFKGFSSTTFWNMKSRTINDHTCKDETCHKEVWEGFGKMMDSFEKTMDEFSKTMDKL